MFTTCALFASRKLLQLCSCNGMDEPCDLEAFGSEKKLIESEGLPSGHDLAHVPDMEVDGPEYMDTEVAMNSRNMKRESDVPLENLEEEIRRETETDRQKMSHVLSSMVSAAFGVSDYVPLSDMLVDSVQFAAESDSR